MLPLDLLAQQAPPPGNPTLQFIDGLARTPLSQILYFAIACTVIRLILWPLLFNTAPHRRTGGWKFAKFGNEVCDALVYAGVIVFMVIRPFGIQTFVIPTESMVDTLRVNDYIVANKLIYRIQEPHAGDIVVFRPPARGLLPQNVTTTDYIKRLVGTPGQVIEIRAGVLHRDGKPVPEPFVTTGAADRDFKLVKDGDRFIPVTIAGGQFANVEPGRTAPEFMEDEMNHERQQRLLSLPPVAVPPGYLLAMGDNRNGSYDGRAWGLFERRALIGRSEFIWAPVTRWRATR